MEKTAMDDTSPACTCATACDTGIGRHWTPYLSERAPRAARSRSLICESEVTHSPPEACYLSLSRDRLRPLCCDRGHLTVLGVVSLFHQRGRVSCVAYRAQLGRVSGSRWGGVP